MIEADVLPRVLHGSSGQPLDLAAHEAAFAPSTRDDARGALLEQLEGAGLTGRGGAAFPTARKARLLRDQRGHHKTVVVNAMESEPASHKEFALLGANPHLVLDGAVSLAGAIGANDVIVCVARDNAAVINHVTRAIHERSRRGRREVTITLQTPPGRYVAGEESALVHWLDDNESLPQYREHRPHILRIGHSPVLVDNAETCANVGLISRFGAQWFRRLGTDSSPGSTLVSVTGAVERATVLEVALGTPLRTILSSARADPEPRALLLGGFGGTWLDGSFLDTPYDRVSLSARGADIGAGVIVVLARQGCGVAETQRVVKWMANESARQCGPCAFGLPALAEDLAHVARATSDASESWERLRRRCDAIDGRGACHHPDGVVRLVRTALEVFRDDIDAHLRGRTCDGARSTQRFVPVPHLERESDLVWQ
jgi:NADH:ubiquinone oxidoreductase subunit F (NADH-binding)